MKKNKFNGLKLIISVIIINLLFQNYLNSQNKTTNNFVSQEQTVNGFSNFFLGTDFAESMIATNPTDQLNTICTFARSKLYYTLDGLNWLNANIPNGPYPDNFVCYDSLGNAYFNELIGNSELIFKSSNKGINWVSYNIY